MPSARASPSSYPPCSKALAAGCWLLAAGCWLLATVIFNYIAAADTVYAAVDRGPEANASREPEALFTQGMQALVTGALAMLDLTSAKREDAALCSEAWPQVSGIAAHSTKKHYVKTESC